MKELGYIIFKLYIYIYVCNTYIYTYIYMYVFRMVQIQATITYDPTCFCTQNESALLNSMKEIMCFYSLDGLLY